MEKILSGQALKDAVFRLIRGTSYIVLFRISTMILGLASMGILTRALTAEDLGIYFILLTIGNFCTFPCQLGMDQGNQRFLSQAIVKDPGSVYDIFTKIRKILMLSSIFTLIILLLSWKWLVNIFFHADQPIILYIFQAGIIIILTYEQMQSSALRAMDMLFKSSLSETCVQSVIFFFSVLFFFLTAKELLTLNLVLLLYCIGGFLSIVISYIWITAAIRPYKEASIGGSGLSMIAMIRISLPMGVATGLAMLRTSMDLLIIGWLLGPAMAGQYGPIKRVINFAVFLTQAINKMLSPIVATLSATHNRGAIEELIRKGAAISTYFSAPLTLAMIVFGDYFLRISFGPRFTSMASVLNVLLIGNLIRSILGSPGIVLQMMGKEIVFMNNNIVYTVLTCVLLLLVTKPYGIMGVSLVASLTLVAQCASLCWLVHRTMNIKSYMKFISLHEIKMMAKESSKLHGFRQNLKKK